MVSDPLPQLDSNLRDKQAAVARALTGMILIAGSVVSEVLSSVIPNQRLDRVAAFVHILRQRLEGLEAGFQRQLADDENVLFLEDVLMEAARAVSEDRRRRLAAMVGNGVRDELLKPMYKRRMLQLISQLNDFELLLLEFHYPRAGRSRRDLPHGPIAYESSPPVVRDMSAVHSSFEPHLLELGLLEQRFQRPGLSGRKEPEIDLKTGMAKSSGVEITSLGMALIRFMESPDAAA
jgi:hypothetical protein